ncbi:MAG: glycosyltransferase [Bacteroidota bacterium]
MAEKFRVLVAPLDWGLGHASRCIPIVRELLKQGFEPILGGTKESLYLLKEDFPELESQDLPAYNIQYSASDEQLMQLVGQAPKVLLVHYAERKLFKRLVQENKVDAVISDNRYGMYSKKIPSVIICHQLSLHYPDTPDWMLTFSNRSNRKLIQKFDECWVPDYGGENNLAGKLSKAKLKIPIRYLGPLSRFQALDSKGGKKEGKIDVLIVLSGPEPQRSLLEAKLLNEIPKIDRHFTLVQGKPGEGMELKGENLRLVPFMNSRELQNAFQEATCVISRSGYSSLMDYEALGMNQLILIPTPGQPEQEYLGDIWKAKQKAIVQIQKELDLKEALREVEKLGGRPARPNAGEALAEAVAALKEQLMSTK